jgi:NADPH:quinone reductase-like Zn-dependent oxidoreductase
MKNLVNCPGSGVKVKIESDTPIPEPSAKQVLIKVVVSGSNPKDWKVPEFAASYDGPDDDSIMARGKRGVNQGDDIAGIVEKVGKDVVEFKVHSPETVTERRDANARSRRETASQLSMKWAGLEVHTQSMHLRGIGLLSISLPKSLLKVYSSLSP